MAKADVVLACGVLFLAGVLAASFGVSFLLVCAAGCVAAYGLTRRTGSGRYAAVALPLLAGYVYFFFFLNAHEATLQIPYDRETSAEGVVTNEPTISGTVENANVALGAPFHGTVGVVTKAAEGLQYGDRVKLQGVIEQSAAPGAPPSMKFPDVSVLASHQGSRIREVLISFKQFLISQNRSFLPQDQAALLNGMLFGWQGDFTGAFKAAMRGSGTTHLVALSGYNVAIIVLSVAWVLSKFLRRRLVFYGTVGVIALFVAMVGAQASVVRAAIMGFLMLAAREAGREYDIKYALSATAAGMTLLQPSILRYDAGFQLSFLSLLGIVYLSPYLLRVFRRKDPGVLLQSFAITLSAQLAVLPLLLIYFGQASITAVAANVLVLETVPLAMLLGFVLCLANLAVGAAGFLVSFAVLPVLSFQVFVITLFSDLKVPLAAQTLPDVFIVAYYAIFFAVCYRSSRRMGTETI